MKIVGFGDLMMHFSPFGNERFLQANEMKLSFTGAEANVCSALAMWGEDVQYVTKLPKHVLAQRAKMSLNFFGVKTDYVAHGDERMGIYFLEKGHSVRSSAVIYDRQHTAFTNCRYEDYDWDRILDQVDAFCASGITPSLGDGLLNCCEQVFAEVSRRNIPIFFDINLRPTLCSIEKSREIFRKLSPYITHLIGNEEHLKQLLQLDEPASEDENRLHGFVSKIHKITGIKHIAVTVRRTISANKTLIYSAYSNEKDCAISQPCEIDIVDRVGSGDAFTAGLLYSVLHNKSVRETIDFASASCAIKHTINDDINVATLKEIDALMRKNGYDVAR